MSGQLPQSAKDWIDEMLASGWVTERFEYRGNTVRVRMVPKGTPGSQMANTASAIAKRFCQEES